MQSIIDLMKKELNQHGNTFVMSMKFNQLKTDQERVLLIMELCQMYNVTSHPPAEQKSSQQSKMWKDKSNQIFVRNNTAAHFVEACKLYTKSIAFAPNNSDVLSLAYANRSAVLFRLGKYEECVQDIERCLSLNYPDHLRLKILLRKTQCLAKMGSAKAQKSYEETLDWIEKGMDREWIEKANMDCEKMKKKLDSCFREAKSDRKEDQDKSKTENFDFLFEEFYFKKANEEVPVASEAVAVVYNEKFGRHLVATRDIRPGEIIANETPYCTALNVINKYTHCWECLEYAWNGIPCDHCVHAVYCSEKCKEESWKRFHDVECRVLEHLYGSQNEHEMEDLGTLSLRLAIKAVREMGGIDNLMKEVEDVEKCTDLRVKGFSKDGKFHSDKYRSAYSLITNSDKRFTADLFDRSMYAAFIVMLLATKTDFFGKKLPENWKELRSNAQVSFIAGLILRHQQIIPSNVHSYAEERDLDTYERGSAAMPFFSFTNHSCDANISRSCRKGYQLMFAVYPIKKGEQIFDNYGSHYAIMSKTCRQERLSQQFFFHCQCVACEEDWPMYKQLKSYNVTVKSDEVKVELTRTMQHYMAYMKSAMSGKIGEQPFILQNLSDMVQELLKHVPMPCKEVNNVIEMIKRVFDLNGNRFVLPAVVT